MPTNELRRHSKELLSLSLKAHDDGHIAEAHSLTVRAADLLEGAISIEKLRVATSRSSSTQKTGIGDGPGKRRLIWLAVAERHVQEGSRQLLQQRELLSRLQTQGHSKSATAGMARETASLRLG